MTEPSAYRAVGARTPAPGGGPAKVQRPHWYRFWVKVDFGECWIWMGGRKSNGYGTFADKATGGAHRRWVTKGAHRWAWEYFNGPIPDGLHIDHLCRNRACVNPGHMEPVHPGENIHRGLKGVLRTACTQGHPFTAIDTYVERVTGRHICRICARRRNQERKLGHRTQNIGQPRGEAHPFHVLTEAKVREIRALASSGERMATLGRQFGVSKETVRAIVKRWTWTHVDQAEAAP